MFSVWFCRVGCSLVWFGVVGIFFMRTFIFKGWVFFIEVWWGNALLCLVGLGLLEWGLVEFGEEFYLKNFKEERK